CSRVALLIGEGGVEGRAPPLREGERGPRGDLFIAALRARGPRSLKRNYCTGTRMRQRCNGEVKPAFARVGCAGLPFPGARDRGIAVMSRLCARTRRRP